MQELRCFFISVLCFTISKSTIGFEADLSLQGWNVPRSTREFHWISFPQKPKSSQCTAKGLLKITTPSNVKGVEISLGINWVSGYNFHISTSRADGWGGSYAAEIHNRNSEFAAYRRNNQKLVVTPWIITPGIVRINLKTSDMIISVNNIQMLRSRTDNMFKFPGTIYLGINRVHNMNYDPSRWGTGTCKVKITWL